MVDVVGIPENLVDQCGMSGLRSFVPQDREDVELSAALDHAVCELPRRRETKPCLRIEGHPC